MKIIAVLLTLVGLGGVGLGAMMFGDIGVAAMVGGLVGMLSGSGFWMVANRLRQ